MRLMPFVDSDVLVFSLGSILTHEDMFGGYMLLFIYKSCSIRMLEGAELKV